LKDEDLEEIRVIQQKARAVSQKHMATQALIVQEKQPGVSGSSSIHLKKPLVTHIFSVPAVTTRRSRRNQSSRHNQNAVHVERDEYSPLEMMVSVCSPPAATTAAEGPGHLRSLSSHQPFTANTLVQEELVMIVHSGVVEGATGRTMDGRDILLENPTSMDRRSVSAIDPPTPTSPAHTDSAASPVTFTATELRASSDALPASSPTKSIISERVQRLRQQPKSAMMEAQLAARYAAIQDVGDRAYQILCDLEMIVPSPNPYAPDYDNSMDDDLAVDNTYQH
jgi:hypothetical protein